MNCLLVPTLALDVSLLDRLANSIDYRIANKIVVNNGKPAYLRYWANRHLDWRVWQAGRNLGVAGAWNLAPQLFKEDAWLIVNDDQMMVPGVLEKICRVMDAHQDADVFYVNHTDAMDMFGWTRKSVSRFGLFDENIWPAYLEDYEMRMRFWLAPDTKCVYVEDELKEKIPVIHGKPKPCSLRYHLMLNGCGRYNDDYYLRKWGVIGDKEPKFRTPFNSGLPLAFWNVETELRAKREEIWQEWWNNNPQLYD